ncbi:MAG: hypothetical protein U5L96_15860 [Owenweeksia sp.]|nr:hypothetical protein [Owenweeksia sp.]
MQLQDTIAGTRYLSTASGISQEASWEFYLRMDFNPSGSNYAKVYLMSDRQDLNGPLNGYFVRIGGSSEDRISLFKQRGAAATLLAESSADWVDMDPVQVRIKVERLASNQWLLLADTAGGFNYQSLATAVG